MTAPGTPDADASPEAGMQSTDYTQLDDPEFFEERRRVRDELERLPAHHANRATLAELYDAMTDEFTRRAASAWQAS